MRTRAATVNKFDAATGERFLDGRVALYQGDSRDILRAIPSDSIDSVVTDPPYALVSIVKRFGSATAAPVNNAGTKAGNAGDPYARASAGFMGQSWDTGETAFAPEFWAEVMRVLKPGGYVVAASGTRTYHRLAVAIEDAGFEIRDMVSWLYGSGFPKSHNVAVSIDKANGAKPRGKSFNMKGGGDRAEEFAQNGRKFLPPYATATDAAREWDGWGTALKPACEPWVLARKPLGKKTVAANVLAHGTGALNIDGARIGDGEERATSSGGMGRKASPVYGAFGRDEIDSLTTTAGRWPANVLFDDSAEVRECFGETYRYFYSAKADADDRLGSKHPTVKPVDLMQYLVRLVTPKGGTVLDPFAGTGTTGEAAWREGMCAVLVERELPYCADIRRRLALAAAGPDERKRESFKANGKAQAHDDLPLFGGE